MVVAQAVALLLWDVLLLGASFIAGLMERGALLNGQHSGQQTEWPAQKSGAGSGVSNILASRSEVSLFVELLVFGALLTGLIVSQLLRALQAPAALPERRQKEPSQAVSVAADGSREAVAADRRRQNGALGRQGAEAIKAKRRGIVGLLGLVLGLAVLAALQLAPWALGYALSSWRRVALLGYWAVLLAGALPFMDWVANRVPTIIVRKVRCSQIACHQSACTINLP